MLNSFRWMLIDFLRSLRYREIRERIDTMQSSNISFYNQTPRVPYILTVELQTKLGSSTKNESNFSFFSFFLYIPCTDFLPIRKRRKKITWQKNIFLCLLENPYKYSFSMEKCSLQYANRMFFKYVYRTRMGQTLKWVTTLSIYPFLAYAISSAVGSRHISMLTYCDPVSSVVIS